MSGDDKFTISGTGKNSSLIRIIPGAGADILSDKSSVAGGRKTVHVYDDKTSGLKAGNESRIHISDNTAENNYQYTHFKNDDRGFVFKPGLTIGVGYKIQTQRWRKAIFIQAINIYCCTVATSYNIEQLTFI